MANEVPCLYCGEFKLDFDGVDRICYNCAKNIRDVDHGHYKISEAKPSYDELLEIAVELYNSTYGSCGCTGFDPEWEKQLIRAGAIHNNEDETNIPLRARSTGD
jgi:hypothetical protein